MVRQTPRLTASQARGHQARCPGGSVRTASPRGWPPEPPSRRWARTRTVVCTMYYDHKFLGERQRQLQEVAQAQSQAPRAKRNLARAHGEAMRLRAELALRTDS